MTLVQLKWILITLIVVYVEPFQDVLYDRMDDTQAVNEVSLYTTRCSRRFTPGVCTDSVVSVWTFVYHLQNCTERLGCPNESYRTNRFKSYELCMFLCRPLNDLYLQLISYDGRNETSSEQERLTGNSSRRDALEAQYIIYREATSREEPRDSEVKIEELEDEPIPSMMMYRDSLDMKPDDVFPADIDYVLGGNDSG